MYEVTIATEKANKQEVIFTTPSINAAISCGRTLVGNAGITNMIWIGFYLYASFLTEDYFDTLEVR